MVITTRFIPSFNFHISVICEESLWKDHLSLSIDIDHTFRVELPLSYSEEEIDEAAENLIEDYLSILEVEKDLL